MRRKGKKKNSELSDFLRYSENKMTNSERNAFERELQKDPFLEEAAEGFEGIPSEETEEDLTILRKRLKARTVRKQRYIYYRIAASVAVLMVITTVFILLERNRLAKQQEEIVNQPVAIVIQKTEPLTKPSGKAGATEKLPALAEKKANKSASGQIGKEVEKEEALTDKVKSETVIRVENAHALKIKEAERIIAANQMAAPIVAIAGEEPAARRQISGKVIASDDNQPIPGASIIIKGTTIGTTTDTGGNFKLTLPDASNRFLIANFIGMESKEFQATGDSVVKVSLEPSVLALNEVVVVGYGSKRSKDITAVEAVSRIEMEKKVSEGEYNPPEPVTGKENYDKYIEDNLRRPDVLKEGEIAVVVVSFIVQSNGIIDSIKIIRSPGRPFSDEATRLIKEGPGWKPANENGKTINDEVRIRIVFK